MQKSQDQKKEWRQDWALKRLQDIKTQFHKTATYKKVDISKKVYRSFSRVVKERGAEGRWGDVHPAGATATSAAQRHMQQ